MAKNLILRTFLSPGDVCTLTTAIESLHAFYPRHYLTDVRTSCDAIFLHNPHITPLKPSEALVIDMHYTDLISRSNQVPHSFLAGYCHYLGRILDITLPLLTNRPYLYLSDQERSSLPMLDGRLQSGQGFWIVNAGVKSDFTLKQWPVEYFQEVIDYFAGRILFVQVGDSQHDHPRLRGVIDLVGQTGHRELIQLCYHALGGVGPITYVQHLMAAFQKPYVALLGGREPVSWVQYPLQTTLHTMGKLPCCRERACWKSRVIRLNDGRSEDSSICELPVLDFERPVGKCMAMIKPIEVIRAIEACYEVGTICYDMASRPALVGVGRET